MYKVYFKGKMNIWLYTVVFVLFFVYVFVFLHIFYEKFSTNMQKCCDSNSEFLFLHFLQLLACVYLFLIF